MITDKTVLNQVWTEKRLLQILRLLHMEPDFSMAIVDLQSSLQLMGHGVAVSVIRADATWLCDNKLTVLSDMDILHLNEMGADVANGLLQVNGIARPTPKRYRQPMR